MLPARMLLFIAFQALFAGGCLGERGQLVADNRHPGKPRLHGIVDLVVQRGR
jgi:hypothetical protein